jgi:hypothetical protein
MEKSSPPRSRRRISGNWRQPSRKQLLLIGGVLASLLVGIVLALWFLNGDEPSSVNPTSSLPRRPQRETAVTVPRSGLPGALQGLSYRIYWAGPRRGVHYEVMRRRNGPETRTYIRYLPKDEKTGTKRHFLTVGSYEIANAYNAIHEVGQAPGAILVKAPGGGEAYAEGPHHTNAYLVFPGVGTEIEVYDPEPGAALALSRSGAIVPLE